MEPTCTYCGLTDKNRCRSQLEAQNCMSLDGIVDMTFGQMPSEPMPSTGGSSGYYKLPPSAADLQDLIEEKEMSFARGNLFKALYRMGAKEGVDLEYDLNKLQWFLDRMRLMHQRGKRL